MKGIDVSIWQGIIDWTKVRNDGTQFAILKAGGSDAGFYKDSTFEGNYLGCKAAGIHVGAYYFVGRNCTTKPNGEADAHRFLEMLKGKQFDMPVYLDFEAPNAGDVNGNTQAAIGFCNVMEKAGYYVGIYASDISGFKEKLHSSALRQFTWWVARYGDRPVYAVNSLGMWQYSSNGAVDGIKGRVDMDECYVDFPTAIKSKGLNGYGSAKPVTKPAVKIPVEKNGIYRLYNPNNGGHLFTASYTEAVKVATAGWKYEGIAWHDGGDTVIYRLRSNKDHVYLPSCDELVNLILKGWTVEGIAFRAHNTRTDTNVPVFRLYNKNNGVHTYTIDEKERDKLVKAGWILETVKFYVNK